MSKNKLPKSIRKFLRRKKAEIRRQFSDSKETREKIKELLDNLRQSRNKKTKG